jgi:hypothetical protein
MLSTFCSRLPNVAPKCTLTPATYDDLDDLDDCLDWNARAALGRHEEAIADFTEAIHLRPELVYPRIARSESYGRIGDSRRPA